MSSACPVVDLSSFQEERALLRLREAVREAADRLVDRMTENLFSKKGRTFLELSQALQEARQEFPGDLLGKLIEVEYGDLLSEKVACCPRCGKDVKKSDDVSKNLESLQGSTSITRPYFYCADCRLGFYPLDEALGLCRESKQGDLQKVALELLAEMPFERARDLFKKATGISFSDHQMHSLFAAFAREAGVEDVIPSAAEIDRRIEEVGAVEGKRPVLVVAVDGVHAPTRPPGGRSEKRGPGQYKEVKGFRLYLPKGDDIVPIARGAFPVCKAGFQHLSSDWPSVMFQKLLYKIQTTTPTHPPPSRRRRLLPFPVLPLPSWEGQGEGEHEMAHEDKQGMHPLRVGTKRRMRTPFPRT